MHSAAYEDGFNAYYCGQTQPPHYFDADMRRDWQAGYDEAAFEDSL